MSDQAQPIQARGNFINGAFAPPPSPEGEVVSLDPYLDQEVGRVHWSTLGVAAATDAARAAQAAWQARPLTERIAAVRAIAPVLEKHKERLAQTISREMGKPVWEARTEVAAAIGKVEISATAGLELVAEHKLADGSSYAFKPHGVLAVLGPFNFPLHLMHGHVMPALLLGNTVVLKPSEHAPFTGQIYAEILAEAGLPPGVFNLVQGAVEVGAALAAHPEVNGVLFTGSYRAGLAIQKATLEQPGKLLALEMGGKNPAVLLGDAPLDKALYDIAWGAYVTSGQRCSGTALCLVERSLLGTVRERLSKMLGGIRIGNPREEVFMGPLAFAAARQSFEDALNDARSSGARLVAKSPCPDGSALAAASLHEVDHFDVANAYLREELFGPDLTLVPVDDLEHAVSVANSLPYGLATSVFTADADRFEWARARLEYGCINHNAPTCGASSKLPFGGVKQSGNHRPAALWSSLYCAYPVATLRGGATLDPTKRSPGLDW
ncbi:MAG: aldehyde dehydrogenase family protein [Polyangiaceae bacterium]|nr:aldehyde dehydrogenase family protein [Myxococcales bacterium]MCB9591042.1 aldehyde dehydrogenase family protein [Polyangiaceae bacterium]MCB9610373.1 aldehyde dehydrogenase family protein [Polyangiaceae bacterium]